MRTHDQERGGWRHKRDMDRCASCHISTDDINIVCTASRVLYVTRHKYSCKRSDNKRGGGGGGGGETE